MASRNSSLVEGPLSKWTNVVSGWQYRWFVLDQSAGLLAYYTSKDKMRRGSRRGCITLRKAIVGIDDEDNCTFTIHSDGRTYHFQAQDFEERERWIQAMEHTIRRLKQPLQKLELNLPQIKRGLSVENRLLICESYHALLTEQLKTLSECMNNSNEAKKIQKTAQDMIAAMKHCIDLMKEEQISEKSSVNSFLEVPSSGHEELPGVSVTSESQMTSENGSKESLLEDEEPSDVEGEGEDDSSSVNSDEFYDAEDEPAITENVVTSPSVSIPAAEGDPSDIEEADEYNELDNASSGVAENKSLIMHMISQVRIGMDLHRVTLPTFILEKRSLLEMYADFLAHPDLFANINDFATPKERIVAAVRYFLSSFHAARKGTVAKKPYNATLGEIFRCYWDLPDSDTASSHPVQRHIIDNGPVQFASNNSVTFIAEQVSHHPPISSFYAECPSKHMYANGSIHTKSKFLGLSLATYLVGKLTLTLMDHNEDYECTLPNAYARSILTVPWMELGGKCYIKCEKSGYHAVVEFHCKPFYGGKRHRVTADIYEGTDRKPFMKVEGEWNGIMYIKHSNGDEEVFVDTINSPTIRKKYKKLEKQEDNESMKKWYPVTVGLRDNDIDVASNAKHAIEEKQRAEALERLQQGIEWKQKYFNTDGELWWYNEPLSKRMAAQISLEENN